MDGGNDRARIYFRKTNLIHERIICNNNLNGYCHIPCNKRRTMAFKETPQTETFTQADLWKVLLNFKTIMEEYIGKCYEQRKGIYHKIISAGLDYFEILVIETSGKKIEMYFGTIRNEHAECEYNEITQSEFNMKYAEFLAQSEKMFKTKLRRK